MEVFHFSRSHGLFDPLPLNLTILGGFIFHSKETWHYLGFIFDRKLTFQQYINFYMNKVLSTVKCMKMHRNLSRGLIPIQKQLLYRSCVLLIILYGFQLWYYNKAPLAYLLKELRKMQRRATIWIFGVFRTSSSLSIKAVVGLIPIHLHLQKLSSRF